MSRLFLYHASNPNRRKLFVEQLSCEGVRLEKWSLKVMDNVAWISGRSVLAAYQQKVDEVKEALGYRCADFVTIDSEKNSAVSLRDKYLSEHVHSEHEVRFFISGSALLFLHVNSQIHTLHCLPGDFLIIPKGMKHWLDMGPKPKYQCIRWYDSSENLANELTGSYIAESTPRWEAIMEASEESLELSNIHQPS
jgi:1,2-dihydroxy-3-keto-5-methylthiopentene dioxygenase